MSSDQKYSSYGQFSYSEITKQLSRSKFNVSTQMPPESRLSKV